MQIRYSLLPYMYTLFYHAHTPGDTVMRALAWEFPNDPQLASIDNQFMLGPSLLITPVLEPLINTTRGVFPGVASGTIWYDWYTLAKVNAQAGLNTTIDAPLGHIPLYIRGGPILTLQEPGNTTETSRRNPYSLLNCRRWPRTGEWFSLPRRWRESGATSNQVHSRKYSFA